MENPGAARLDRATEDALYALYRSYFEEAEESRRWSPWVDVPWDEAYRPPAALVEAVIAAYRDDLFLPDYSTHALLSLRSSRGRAWFATRWSYEKGKGLIAFTEWLLRSHATTDDDLRDMSEELLRTWQWVPPHADAPAVLCDMLFWEAHTRERNLMLRQTAQTAGDDALVTLLNWILADQTAAQAFFHAALETMAQRHGAMVQDAAARVRQSLSETYSGGDTGAGFAALAAV